MDDIEFLELNDVLLIHIDQISRYGGEATIRDLGLLESAIAQPQAGFGGELLHSFPFEMAAAYLFHIVMNHPFLPTATNEPGQLRHWCFLTGMELKSQLSPANLQNKRWE